MITFILKNLFVSAAKLHSSTSPLPSFVDIGSITTDLMLPSSKYFITTVEGLDGLLTNGKGHQLAFFDV